MKTIIHRVLAATTLLAGVAVGTVAGSAPAQASSCGPGTNAAGQTVYYCSIWTPSGGTPVYSSTSSGSTIVGRLYTAGSANWFYCQQNGSTASVGGYSSSNWAKTKADNGATGWVPANYYTGSEPYWPGMPTCATSTPPTSTQKIVNHTFYGQINGYYCGPASTQIALSSWGRSYSQDYLASRLGTTINGTDSISQVASVLNSLTASSYYQVTWIDGDYASATQGCAEDRAGQRRQPGPGARRQRGRLRDLDRRPHAQLQRRALPRSHRLLAERHPGPDLRQCLRERLIG